MAEKNTSRLLIKFNEHTGPVVWSHTVSAGLVGVQVQIKAGLLPVFIYFLFFSFCFFFHRIFTHWLVSVYSHCWPFLAWRDFCDNVFLVRNIGKTVTEQYPHQWFPQSQETPYSYSMRSLPSAPIHVSVPAPTREGRNAWRSTWNINVRLSNLHSESLCRVVLS